MIILTARLASASSFWSHRKIRATELIKVHPKQAKQSSFLLNLLMTKAAVKLASTCEEASAKPLMYMSKWNELSMREGAQNSKEMVHCSSISTSVRYLVDLYLNISSTVTFFICTLAEPYWYFFRAPSISERVKSASTPFTLAINSIFSKAAQGEFLMISDIGVSTAKKHMPANRSKAGMRQQKRNILYQSQISQYQKMLMTEPIPQKDWINIVAFSLALRSTVSTKNMKQMMQQLEMPSTATDSPPATTHHSLGNSSTVARPATKQTKLTSMSAFFPTNQPNSVSSKQPPAIPKNMMAIKLSSSSLALGHLQSPSSLARLFIVICLAQSKRAHSSNLHTSSRQLRAGSMPSQVQGSWKKRKGTLKSNCPLKYITKAQKIMVTCWQRPKEPTLSTSWKNTCCVLLPSFRFSASSLS